MAAYSKSSPATQTTPPHAPARTAAAMPAGILSHRFLCLAAGMLMLAAAPQTPAQSTAPAANAMETSLTKDLSVIVGGGVTHDSNLFRNPGLLVGKQSETYTTAYVGLRFDKPYLQQRFQLDITQSNTWYDKFSYLDYDALNYSGAWLWQLGTRFSGRLSASRAENLAPFEDTLSFRRNVRITENQAFDLDGWLVDGWHLLLGVSRNDQKSEENLLNREPDFTATNTSLGVKYLTRAGNALTLRHQKTDGEYDRTVGTVNNDYTEDLTELIADWRLSGSSALNARIGWLDRDNTDVALRDFSGPSSSLNYSWTPPGKLSLTLSAGRRTSPLQGLTASYREQDTLAVIPTWRISDKTSTYLRLSYEESTDKGILIPLPSGPRRDTTTTAALGLGWSATPKLTINASIERQDRSSTSILNEYDATIARINAAFAF